MNEKDIRLILPDVDAISWG